jgi:hypothetical protein
MNFCLPFLCALVLNTESIRLNPINLRPSCEAWEMEKCEEQSQTFDDQIKRRLTIFNEKTGELMPNIKLYQQKCINNDPWNSEDCESFIGEQYVEY